MLFRDPSTACRIYRLALLLVAAVAALSAPSWGAVRFDVFGSPTEVASTGRSEVTGTITLAVRGTNNVTGNSTGGPTQIGLIYTNPAMQIDNTLASGIRLVFSSGFAPASPTLVSIENRDIAGQCSGFITINLLPGAAPLAGDFLRVEGVRGRIDASSGLVAGTDLYVDLQSVNDPAANSFSPDRLRVAKSLKALVAVIFSDSLTYEVRITEGFSRAFVDLDSGNDGNNTNDRVDSTGALIGAPTNSTQVQLRMEGVPGGITNVAWPSVSTVSSAGSAFYLIGSTFTPASDVAATNGVATATYSYEATHQVGQSDIALESFTIGPLFIYLAGKCNTDTLTTSVKLAPAVPKAPSCGAPVAGVSRPRFLDVAELQVTSILPSTVTAGGAAFSLTVNGSGFTSASKVLVNGAERVTTFVSATQLTAQILASDILAVGNASISVTDISIGGATSNARILVIAPPGLTLFYPRLVTSPRASASTDDSEYTGVALANTSGRVATLKLTAYDKTGTVITGTGITNPATLTIPAGQQRPLVDSQIFGSGWGTSRTVAWLKVEGDVPQIAGFFLAFNGSLSRLDGADVGSTSVTSAIFPEVEARGTTQLHVANAGLDAGTLTVELVKSDGSLRATAVTRPLSGNGVLVETLGELFPGVTVDASDYIRVSSNRSVVGFEYMAQAGKDVSGLNGQDASLGAKTLYSPQYVVGGPDWRTTLSLVNLDTVAGTLSFKFIGDDGVQIGSTQAVTIPARGKLSITDQKFFLDAGNTLRQGYLEITGNVRLIGSVVFGNPDTRGFVTALPLVGSLQSQVVFSQVASNAVYYTGIALLNPSDDAANAVIQVFDASGAVIASKIESIPARSRRSRLLTEFFPALASAEIASGYITVSVNRNVAAFALFGDRGLTVLSAVPAQTTP
jgi:hypothetical protein